MAISDTLHRSAFSQAATALCVLAVLVAHVGGRSYSNSSRYVCPIFSCGELRDVSYPFRRPEDPDGCGVASYELSCSDTKAAIQINTGTYYVVDINYTGSSFVVVDASLDMQSSCPLPRWDQVPYPNGLQQQFPPYSVELSLAPGVAWANFVNCSQAVRNNHTYIPVPVDCLSTSNSFVYVLTAEFPFSVGDLDASCGYLALIPFGGVGGQMALVNDSFADVVRFMRDGFGVHFPIQYEHGPTLWKRVMDHIHDLIR